MMTFILMLLVVALPLWGCGDDDDDIPVDGGGDMDADTDGDGGADGDADSDADADADGDADTDADGDSDSDTDAVLYAAVSPVVNVVDPDTQLSLVGTVTDPDHAAADLTVTWISDIDGVIGSDPPDAEGTVTIAVVADDPREVITLEVVNPDSETASANAVIAVCEPLAEHGFDTALDESDFEAFGDAFWDFNGWVEMTGDFGGKKGAVFDTSAKLAADEMRITFDVRTGPKDGNGADGCSLSVIDTADALDLAFVLDAAGTGGSQGYGIPDDAVVPEFSGFHVEVDTYAGGDPTSEDHLAVMLDGDASTHHVWGAVGNIEEPDLSWHTVDVHIIGDGVRLDLDGAPVADGSVPGFEWTGGYLGFTGATGGATNYHAFDNLSVCVVPDD